MTDLMLQQINDAIVSRLHKLASKDDGVIKNLFKKYDDIEVTSQSQLTQLCFEYADKKHTLNMGKLDEEEYKNIDNIYNELYIQYEFMRKLDSILYPEILTNRIRQLDLLLTSIDYYRIAYDFVLDLTVSKEEDSNDK